jgi:hypothetical protein
MEQWLETQMLFIVKVEEYIWEMLLYFSLKILSLHLLSKTNMKIHGLSKKVSDDILFCSK